MKHLLIAALLSSAALPALAVTEVEVVKTYADIAEAGYADTSSDNWYGLLAPAKTPPAIVAKINDAFVKAINDSTVKQKLIDSGAVPVADKPEAFGQTLKSELARWGKVVREKGIKETN